MSWFDILFGKREKFPLLTYQPSEIHSGIETVIYLHNSKEMYEYNYLTADKFIYMALDYAIRRSLGAEPPPPRQELVIEHGTEALGPAAVVGTTTKQLRDVKPPKR